MARKAIYKHATLVNAGTYPDDGTSPVGTAEWNEAPDPAGMLGCTPATANSSTIIVASGVATITDSVSVIAGEGAATDTLQKLALANTNEYDLVYLFAASSGYNITLEHGDLNADGEISTISGANETLSTTVPTILMRKGNYWHGYGGVITPTDITVADSTDTTCFPALFESATGDLAPKTDAGLTYNAGTGMLTATGLTGPLTGNASGSSATCSGLAATATALATARTIGGTSFDGTGNIAITTNANLTGDVTSSGNATTIATDAVDIAMLSATGTAGSSTFLRGDNSWQAISAGASASDNITAGGQTLTLGQWLELSA